MVFMKKSISVLAVFALSHLTFLGQTNLQTLFEKKLDYNTNLFKGNIYLCDSVIYSDYLSWTSQNQKGFFNIFVALWNYLHKDIVKRSAV